MTHPLPKQLGAEALGTFCLVFAGTGAIVIDGASGGAITHAGVAAAFGLAVMVMIYALGDISGAHLNPAVTLGFVAARRFPLRAAGPFVASQCAGALLASGCLRVLFPDSAGLGNTVPAGSAAQALAFEAVLSFMLMFVILSVSIGAKEKGVTAGLAIGATVMLAALFGGPVSGASMNPARTLGPAFATLDFTGFWIYLAGPLAGALAAVLACRCVRESTCCRGPREVPAG